MLIIYNIKSKLTFALIILFVFTIKNNFAQSSGSIRGYIYEKETGEPLTGANVLLANTSLGAASDLDGRFIIRSAPAGSYKLLVSYIGYNSVSLDITIQVNKTVEQDVYLAAKTITGETITITAQAEGQLSAINQQLSSNTISNIVSKARIKELPDVNAAESIGRLPGVSLQRYGGEATKVEVRGLDPKYSLITVNGVELPATSSMDRSVDLSLVSSNMLDGITLKKSTTPDMDADVIGGTIDLKLREATQGFQDSLSAQGGYNALQKYYGNYSFTGNVSNRFFDNQLGVIININVDNYDRSADKLNVNWVNYGRGGAVPDTISIGQLTMREEKINRKRAGASILLDYNIPNGKITANGFFNQLKENGLYHVNIINTATLGYSTNRRFFQLEEYKSTTNVFTSAFAIQQDFDWIRYDANVSRSGTLNSSPDRREWQFNQENGAIDAAKYYPFISTQDLAEIAYVDSNNALLAQLYSTSTRLIENSTSAKFNVEIPFHLGEQISGSIKAGGKLRLIDRRNDEGRSGYQGLQYGGGSSTLNVVYKYLDDIHPEWKIKEIVTQNGGLSIAPFLSDYSRSNFLNNEYPLGPVADLSILNKMTDELRLGPSNLWIPNAIQTYGNDYKGLERYKALYLMSELNWGDFLTLIPGVRYEDEYTSYDGQRYRQVQSGQTAEQPPSEYVRLSKTRKNYFWLPMINVIIKPTNWLQVKMAGTKTIARPDFRQYAPISYVDAQSTQINATNYGLKTSQATNLDMSVAVFNNDIGLLSASAFYKNIKDLIFYSNFKLVGGVAPDPNLDIPTGWYKGSSPQVNTFRNNPNPSKYYGFEIEWQTHFWYLPSVLSGLVLNINYTRINSEMNLQYDSLRSAISGFPPRTSYSFVQRSIKTRMPNQPKYVLNVTIGYDYEGFSARLSYLYQTDKLTSIGYDGTLPTTRLSSYQGAYGRWDFTAQQKVTKQLQVYANFNNLNSRRDQNIVGAMTNSPSSIEYYGFSMDLGIRFNL